MSFRFSAVHLSSQVSGKRYANVHLQSNCTYLVERHAPEIFLQYSWLDLKHSMLIGRLRFIPFLFISIDHTSRFGLFLNTLFSPRDWCSSQYHACILIFRMQGILKRALLLSIGYLFRSSKIRSKKITIEKTTTRQKKLLTEIKKLLG